MPKKYRILVVAEMAQEERKLIKERQTQARDTAQVTMASQYSGVVLILIVGTFLIFKMRRDLAGPQRNENLLKKNKNGSETRFRMLFETSTDGICGG